MNSRRQILRAALVVLLLSPATVRAQYQSSITFRNGSGENALVKLVGPSARTVTVANGADRAETGIAPGRYYIMVRYGNPENYSYTKGDSFEIQEYGNQYSEISITLHKVVNGNYGSRPARKDEFEGAR